MWGCGFSDFGLFLFSTSLLFTVFNNYSNLVGKGTDTVSINIDKDINIERDSILFLAATSLTEAWRSLQDCSLASYTRFGNVF